MIPAQEEIDCIVGSDRLPTMDDEVKSHSHRLSIRQEESDFVTAEPTIHPGHSKGISAVATIEHSRHRSPCHHTRGHLRRIHLSCQHDNGHQRLGPKQ